MGKTDRSYHHGNLQVALIAEAAAMIGEGGVACLTMRALGQRLGVSRAAAYRHFRDKNALLVAVATAGFERLWERLNAAQERAPSTDGLRRMGEEYVRFALENPAHYRLMYGKEALMRAELPELREAADALFEQLVGTIEGHQHSGTVRRQDARAQAYVAWSTVHGLASLLIEGQIQAVDDVDRLIRQATRTLFDGMRPA